jgi:hypothetical protein
MDANDGQQYFLNRAGLVDEACAGKQAKYALKSLSKRNPQAHFRDFLLRTIEFQSDVDVIDVATGRA